MLKDQQGSVIAVENPSSTSPAVQIRDAALAAWRTVAAWTCSGLGELHPAADK